MNKVLDEVSVEPEMGSGTPANRKNRRPSTATVVAAVLALLVIGLVVMGVAVLALVRGSGSVDSTLFDNPVELPAVADAPDADLVMVATDVGASGRAIDETVGTYFRGTNDVIAGSAIHLFDTETPYGTHHTYRWEAPASAPGDAAAAQDATTEICIGGYGTSGGFARCETAETAQTTPNVSAGSTETTTATGRQVSYYLTVDGLDDSNGLGAVEWVVVDTASGRTVASRVFHGGAFLEWPAFEADDHPVTVRALDADHSGIWVNPVDY